MMKFMMSDNIYLNTQDFIILNSFIEIIKTYRDHLINCILSAVYLLFKKLKPYKKNLF